MTKNYFQHKTDTPPINKLLCLLFGLAIIFFLAYGHGVLTAVNPIVYLGFVVTIAFGLIFGILYRVISKICKVRDGKFILISGLGIMVLGMYFSWGAYILFLSDQLADYFATLGLLVHPDFLFRTIGELYAYGSWSMGSTVVRGFPLIFIWLIELGMVLFATYRALSAYQPGPFNERFNKWYVKYNLFDEFQSLANDNVFFELEGTTLLDKIAQLNKGNSTRFGRISLFMLENSGEAYLLYQNVGRDSRGKKEEATTVIEYLALSNNEARQIIAKYHGKKEFVFEY